MERLHAAFQQRYQNVTIHRVSRSFEDLSTTLRLAISGTDAQVRLDGEPGCLLVVAGLPGVGAGSMVTSTLGRVWRTIRTTRARVSHSSHTRWVNAADAAVAAWTAGGGSLASRLPIG